MNRIIAGAALAAALLGSATAYAADTSSSTATPAAAPTPPATLKCTAPKVPTQVTDKDGKTTWKCMKPKA